MDGRLWSGRVGLFGRVAYDREGKKDSAVVSGGKNILGSPEVEEKDCAGRVDERSFDLGGASLVRAVRWALQGCFDAELGKSAFCSRVAGVMQSLPAGSAGAFDVRF